MDKLKAVWVRLPGKTPFQIVMHDGTGMALSFGICSEGEPALLFYCPIQFYNEQHVTDLLAGTTTLAKIKKLYKLQTVKFTNRLFNTL